MDDIEKLRNVLADLIKADEELAAKEYPGRTWESPIPEEWPSEAVNQVNAFTKIKTLKDVVTWIDQNHPLNGNNEKYSLKPAAAALEALDILAGEHSLDSVTHDKLVATIRSALQLSQPEVSPMEGSGLGLRSTECCAGNNQYPQTESSTSEAQPVGIVVDGIRYVALFSVPTEQPQAGGIDLVYEASGPVYGEVGNESSDGQEKGVGERPSGLATPANAEQPQAEGALEELIDSIESVARDMRRVESGESVWGKQDAAIFASNIEHDVKKFRKSQATPTIPHDLEKLKRPVTKGKRWTGYDFSNDGWNQAIDHLAPLLSVNGELLEILHDTMKNLSKLEPYKWMSEKDKEKKTPTNWGKLAKCMDRYIEAIAGAKAGVSNG